MELTKELVQELKKLPTGNIADNNNSISHQGVMDSGIKPVDPKTKMVGRAYTVQCMPGDNLALIQVVSEAREGDVLVIDLHGYTEGGHFGDLMATACKVRGLAGVVIDGSCRDSQDIREMGFPVFARAYNPSGTVKENLAKTGLLVFVGGVYVRTGDIVFGDCDGVVVIPQEDEDEVFEKALQKYDREQRIIEGLKQGKTLVELFGVDDLIAVKERYNERTGRK